MVELWTDGSCKANGKNESIGSWGYLIKEGNISVTSKVGIERSTTNNRMEMMAIYKGLEKIKEIYGNVSATVYSDSAYTLNCVNQKWYEKWEKNDWKTSTRTPVKNDDLWKLLIPYFKNSNYTFIKVKGHNGIKENEMVDNMVQSAAQTYKEKIYGKCDSPRI